MIPASFLPPIVLDRYASAVVHFLLPAQAPGEAVESKTSAAVDPGACPGMLHLRRPRCSQPNDEDRADCHQANRGK